MVCAGSVDWDDLINGGANVAHQGDGYLALHIAVEYELVPVLKAILPAGHLSIAALALINAGSILNTALIAQREGDGGLAGRAETAFMQKKSQGVHGINAIFHAQSIERLSLAASRGARGREHTIDELSTDGRLASDNIRTAHRERNSSGVKGGKRAALRLRAGMWLCEGKHEQGDKQETDQGCILFHW